MNMLLRKVVSGVPLILLGILLIIPREVTGQRVITSLPRFSFTTTMQYMVPREPVNRFLDDADIGYNLELMYRVRHNKPFLAGLYWTESWLSKEVRRYTDVFDGQTIRIRERAHSRRMELGLAAGVYPEINWLIQPYAIGRVGLGIFQTSSILYDRDEMESLERISEHSSTALAYGLDVGFHVVPKIWFIRLDGRVGFRANPSASLMAFDPESQSGSNFPIDDFRRITSAGTWLTASLGVTLLITDMDE